MGNTPLHIIAAGAGRPAAIGLLVRHGAKVDVLDRAGRTPLVVAVIKEDASTAEQLVAAGADVNFANENGFTVLMLAVKKKQHAIVEMLLAGGARVDDAMQVNGRAVTALDFAMLVRDQRMAELIISGGPGSVRHNAPNRERVVDRSHAEVVEADPRKAGQQERRRKAQEEEREEKEPAEEPAQREIERPARSMHAFFRSLGDELAFRLAANAKGEPGNFVDFDLLPRRSLFRCESPRSRGEDIERCLIEITVAGVDGEAGSRLACTGLTLDPLDVHAPAPGADPWPIT